MSHHKANLNFLFLSFCVYLFKKCPSQFLSNWELADPVFCSEQLRCLPYKNQNKSQTLSPDGKVQICCIVRIYTKGQIISKQKCGVLNFAKMQFKTQQFFSEII